MIGLIGAMAVEVEALEKKLEGRRETTIGMDTFVSGKLFGVGDVRARPAEFGERFAGRAR